MSRDNPRLRANSGKHDGRYFNNRCGERGRQPISFRSSVQDSEHTDQKAAQVASAPPGPLSEVKTKLMKIMQKVDRNRARWIRLGYEWFSRGTMHEVNKAKIETAPQQHNAKHLTEESCSQSRSILEPMQVSSRGKQMVWPSGGNSHREH